jgi:hypothetical protein
MAIDLKVNMAEVNREINRLIKEEDARSERIANRLLMEGKNWAHQLVRKDTGALDTSIDTASEIVKISPCIFSIKLANGMDYGSIQELDPKRGRPHIRPAVRVMQLRARGICQEEYER